MRTRHDGLALAAAGAVAVAHAERRAADARRARRALDAVAHLALRRCRRNALLLGRARDGRLGDPARERVLVALVLDLLRAAAQLVGLVVVAGDLDRDDGGLGGERARGRGGGVRGGAERRAVDREVRLDVEAAHEGEGGVEGVSVRMREGDEEAGGRRTHRGSVTLSIFLSRSTMPLVWTMRRCMRSLLPRTSSSFSLLVTSVWHTLHRRRLVVGSNRDAASRCE